MNEIIQSLYERKSVRTFEARAVAPADKALLFAAAAQAPTAGCQQLYTILDITDQAIKDRLAATCDGQSFIASAPMVLIFCADCRKWWRAYQEAGCAPRAPGVGDLMLAVEDALVAAQNVVTAAHSLGLGSCYIGDILEQCGEHRALLGLPDYVFPAGMLILGHPTPQQRTKPQRFDPRFIVHENRYHDMDGTELREMFAPQAGDRGFDGWMAAFCARKYNAAFSREMTRSVEEYLTQYRQET